MVFGNPSLNTVEGACRMSDTVTDGLSNTVFYTEMYGTCGQDGNQNGPNTYGSLWADSNSIWRPMFGTNTTGKNPPGAKVWPAAFKFQVRPDWLSGCKPDRPQSGHGLGINVCLGDGSVRFVRASIADATWAQICDPRDGAAINGDW
jgi:hypothetical protein